MTKPELKRWKKIQAEEISKRPANSGVWWELYEKYEEDLVKLEPFEDDDDELVKKVNKKK